MSSKSVACPSCGKPFAPQGLPRHVKACQPGSDARRQHDEVIKAAREAQQAPLSSGKHSIPLQKLTANELFRLSPSKADVSL
jgi:hypothetical protein